MVDDNVGIVVVTSFLTLVAAAAVRARSMKTRTIKGSDEDYRTIHLDKDKHYDGVAELASYTYGGHDWILNEYESWFSQGSSRSCIVLGMECVRTGALAGLFVLRPIPGDRVGCLEALRVHPDHRGRGLAHRLQREMIAEARRRKQSGELAVDKLRYSVYDENAASVRVAEGSGMKVAYSYPYLMVAEDEHNPENEFLGRIGPNAIQILLDDCLHAIQSFDKKQTLPPLNTLSSPEEVFSRLKAMGVEVLYQDWKPYATSVDNLGLLTEAKNHTALSSKDGLSLGTIRPDNRGKICIVTHYSTHSDPAMDVLRHFIHWLQICKREQGGEVTSFYCSYPEAAHLALKRLGIVRKEKAQLEYILDLDI